MSNVVTFIQSALECSVYVSPTDYGLTPEEVHEVGRQEGYGPGEINDAIGWPAIQRRGNKLMPMPLGLERGLTVDFHHFINPDYRDFEAFEFVREELLEVGRQQGAQNASLRREILVERGALKGHDRKAIEIAIAVNIIDGVFEDANGVIRQAKSWALPSQQRAAKTAYSRVIERPEMPRILTIVEDVINRRSDGRPASVNAIDAFETCLVGLGQNRFRAWWIQRRAELRSADPIHQPTTILVLAASLAEGALSFVVPRAKKHGLMSRIDIAKPRQFYFDELVKGAKSGNPTIDPILDDKAATRALDLNAARQKIHAGYLLEMVPTGPIPDLRPEEAQDGLRTAEMVIRRVIDWLERHPETSK